METDHTDPAARGCYCGLWETSPKALEEQGVPKGYCGLCRVCGKPGHLRHFPGSVPYTDAWCDTHYRRLMIFHPKGSIGCFVWLAAVAAVVIAVFQLLWR